MNIGALSIIIKSNIANCKIKRLLDVRRLFVLQKKTIMITNKNIYQGYKVHVLMQNKYLPHGVQNGKGYQSAVRVVTN